MATFGINIPVTSKLFRVDGDWLVDSTEIRQHIRPGVPRIGGGMPTRMAARGEQHGVIRVSGGKRRSF